MDVHGDDNVVLKDKALGPAIHVMAPRMIARRDLLSRVFDKPTDESQASAPQAGITADPLYWDLFSDKPLSTAQDRMIRDFQRCLVVAGDRQSPILLSHSIPPLNTHHPRIYLRLKQGILTR